MTYNKSEIMKKAWTIYKNRNHLILNQLRNTPKTASWYGHMLAQVIPFAQILREVWADAKAGAKRAKAMANNPEIAAEINRLSAVVNFGLNGKGYYTCADIDCCNAVIAEKHRLESLLVA